MLVGGGEMKWLNSWREERIRKKEDDEELQESLDLYEEIFQRYYRKP